MALARGDFVSGRRLYPRRGAMAAANGWIITAAAISPPLFLTRMRDLLRHRLLPAPAGWTLWLFSAGAGQLVRRGNRLRLGVGRLLAGHELPDSADPVRRRAAGAAGARTPCFASGSVYRQQGDGPHVPVYCAVWILSGNYDADSWYQVSQARLLPWGCLPRRPASFLSSLKTVLNAARAGLTFLAINLYPFL